MSRSQPDRTVLVANQKGGVGKSSIVSAVAGMLASAGRRVLVVDADQQANITVSDLGVEGDRGRALSMALQFRSRSNHFGTSALPWISSRELPRWLL